MKRIILVALALLAFLYVDVTAQSRRSTGNSAQSRSSSEEVKSSRQSRTSPGTSVQQRGTAPQRSRSVSPSPRRQSSPSNARTTPSVRSGSSSGSTREAVRSSSPERSTRTSRQETSTAPERRNVSGARTAESGRSGTVQNASRRSREINSGARQSGQATNRYSRESSTRSRAINARNARNVESRRVIVNNGPAHRYVSTRRYVHHHHVTYRYVKPRPLAYRIKYRPFRAPADVHIVWSPRVYSRYCTIYPTLTSWRYERSYRIHTISAYEAYRHVGEIRNVYGKVYDAYYVAETDEYFLYVGEVYPYQDFTVVVPGRIARKYSRIPERFFLKEHIAVNGLITVWEDKPEMVIGRADQLRIY